MNNVMEVFIAKQMKLTSFTILNCRRTQGKNLSDNFFHYVFLTKLDQRFARWCGSESFLFFFFLF